MKKLLLLLLLLAPSLKAQELFIQTEPASNMPAGRFGVRISSDFWSENGETASRLGAEIMYGASKEFMVHLQAFGSQYPTYFDLETFGLYGKYRLYSDDGFKYHFRIAAFAEALAGKQAGTMPEFSFKGSAPVVTGGLIFTLLENRLAVSNTLGVSRMLADISLPAMSYSNITGVNASLSAGYLIYPDRYEGYSDPNVNIYAELLEYHSWFDQVMVGNTIAKQGNVLLLSLGPQLILNSVLRFDLAYSIVLQSDYDERRPNSFLARVEYNFY